MNRLQRFALLMTGLALFGATASAQAPFLRAGNKEFNGFAGVSFGRDQQKGMGGANFAYALNKVVMPYVEFGYFPGIARRYQETFGPSSDPFVVDGPLNTKVVDYHGGLHLRIPIAESRFVPYAVIAAGALYQSTDQTTLTARSRQNSQSFTVNAFSGNTFAVNAGGGFRYYFGSGDKWGFRVEAKIYKPTSAPTVNASSAPFGKIVAGLFYTFN